MKDVTHDALHPKGDQTGGVRRAETEKRVGGGVVVRELHGVGLMHHVRVPAESGHQANSEHTLLNHELLEGSVHWVLLCSLGLVLVEAVCGSSCTVVDVQRLAGYEVDSLL